MPGFFIFHGLPFTFTPLYTPAPPYALQFFLLPLFVQP
ncbi:hypothetical protein Y59_00830 [Enterobacter hormaechei]|nr:hypothetical protein Y59_00830 [Enterobacter hormaechei]